MNTNRIIIIPDIHGRDFWKTPVNMFADEEIVFLGDYTDPYSSEGILQEKGLDTLREVIEFKRAHKGNVTLLLGNHDLGYIDRDVCECRMDYMNEGIIQHEILSNLELFDLVRVVSSCSNKYLFSHAGLSVGWINQWPEILRGVMEDPIILNCMLHSKELLPRLLCTLSDVSYERGGYSPFGSCVWADHREYTGPDKLAPGFYHVFGHTQRKDLVKIFNNGVCLDCRKAFVLNPESGSIEPIEFDKIDTSRQ